MRGSRNFCQFYLVLSLFYSLKRGFKGSNGFIAEKTILIYSTKKVKEIVFEGAMTTDLKHLKSFQFHNSIV